MRVDEVLAWGAGRLRETVTPSPGFDDLDDEAAYLLAHCLGVSPTLRRTDLDGIVPTRIETRFRDLIAARVTTRKPAAYLTGETWLGGVRFHVNEQVIVPRSPLAELIGSGFAPWATDEPTAILDLCTGSGCLAVLCALAFPDAAVDATDLSPEALAVARRNVADYDLDGRVCLFEGDLFDPLSRRRYDVIVANPPYVDPLDKSWLPQEYLNEPEMALFAPRSGIALAVRIVREAACHLTPRGSLFLEVGENAPALERHFPDLAFTWLEFERGGEGVALLRREDLPDTGGAASQS